MYYIYVIHTYTNLFKYVYCVYMHSYTQYAYVNEFYKCILYTYINIFDLRMCILYIYIHTHTHYYLWLSLLFD